MSLHHRVLVIFILSFASLADLVVLLMLGKGFLFIINVFIVLFVVFALQDAFKWFRIIVMIYLVFRVLLWLFHQASALDIVQAQQFMKYEIFRPALMPLYLSMCLIAFFSYRFLRTHDIFK